MGFCRDGRGLCLYPLDLAFGLDDCFELGGTPLELMSDNGSPFVVWMPRVLTLFGKTLDELRIRHFRTQMNSPWTNGKIERF